MTTDTLPHWLAQQAEARGYNTALRYKRLGIWHQKTWGDLHQEVLLLAQQLKQKGFGEGDTLFLLSHPRPEATLLAIAAQLLGGVAAPLNPEQESVSLLILLRELQAVFVFAENQFQVDQILELQPRELQLAELQLRHQHIIYADERGLSGYEQPGLVSYSDLLSDASLSLTSYAELQHTSNTGQSDTADTAFAFYRLNEQKQLELQTLSHTEILAHGQQLIAREALTANEEALAARTFAASGHARYLLGPWLLAGFKLNFPENIATRDNDRRELGPTLVAGTAQTYQRLFEHIQSRLPLAGTFQRTLFDSALSTQPRAFFLRKLIAYWLIIRPLRDVIGFSRTRVPLMVGESLSLESARFFLALGIQIRTWPDSTEWQKSAPSNIPNTRQHASNEAVQAHSHLYALLGGRV